MPASAEALALDFVRPGDVVGLGSGRAASAFIRALARRVRQGFRCTGVPTSTSSARLARRCGIPLASLNRVGSPDVTVDGADEVDPDLDLIKGYGGALLREKIVASASRRVVILVGPEKLVPRLGSRGKLPLEVLRFGLACSVGRLRERGLRPRLRRSGGAPFVTDGGNLILDLAIGPTRRPAELEASIRSIPGVIECGLFLGLADTVLIQAGRRLEVRHRA